MKYKIIPLFFVLFSMKDIPLTQSYNISSILQKVETEVASNVKINIIHAKIDDVMRKAFASAVNYRMKQFGYSEKATIPNFVRKGCQSSGMEEIKNNIIDPYGSKIVYDVHFYTHKSDEEWTRPFLPVQQSICEKFDHAEMGVKTEELRISLEVTLRRERKELYSEFAFSTAIHFEDFELYANQTNGGKFSFDMSYRKYYAWHYAAEKEIKWSWGKSNELENKENVLTKTVLSFLPSLLLDHINCNPEFSRAFDEITKVFEQYNSWQHCYERHPKPNLEKFSKSKN